MWSDISNAMRGLKANSLYLIVLDEVLGLELSKFSREVKMKPEINDDHKVIVDMSNDLWFRNDEINEETFTRRNVKQTVAQLEAFTLRKKTTSLQVAALDSLNWSAGGRCVPAGTTNDSKGSSILAGQGRTERGQSY